MIIQLFSAILNLRKKPKEVAVADLMTNTRIGPIFPNLFNLAVLVLNDDNLYALNVPAKKPLQSNVLDMVDALCSNPCSLDTNIQQQVRLPDSPTWRGFVKIHVIDYSVAVSYKTVRLKTPVFILLQT